MPRCQALGCANECAPKRNTGPAPRYCCSSCNARDWKRNNRDRVLVAQRRFAAKPGKREQQKRYAEARRIADPTYFSRLFWERKLKWVRMLGGRCPCGESRLPCLDFDHLDPSTKMVGIATMLRYPAKYPTEVVERELAKCQLLCANCHRLKTSSNWNSVSKFLDDEK